MSDHSPAVVPIAIRVARDLDHSPAVIFNAYADIDERAQWLPASNEAIVFESQNFRLGGMDHFIRGLSEASILAGTTRYEQIVENKRLVFTERLFDSDGKLEVLSVVSWNIESYGEGALLTITDQTTSIVGSGPIEGSKYGYEVMLDRLAGHLAHKT